MNNNSSIGKVKFFAVLTFCLVLCGCGASGGPEKVAKNFMRAYLSLDVATAKALCSEECSASCQVRLGVAEALSAAVVERAENENGADDKNTKNVLKEHRKNLKASFSTKLREGGDAESKTVEVTIDFADEKRDDVAVSVELKKENENWKVFDFGNVPGLLGL